MVEIARSRLAKFVAALRSHISSIWPARVFLINKINDSHPYYQARTGRHKMISKVVDKCRPGDILSESVPPILGAWRCCCGWHEVTGKRTRLSGPTGQWSDRYAINMADNYENYMNWLWELRDTTLYVHAFILPANAEWLLCEQVTIDSISGDSIFPSNTDRPIYVSIFQMWHLGGLPLKGSFRKR